VDELDVRQNKNMTELLPLMRDQRKTDADHLRLLAIFHYIVAGLTIIVLCFLFLHYAVMHAFIANPEIWKNQNNTTPPFEQFFEIFKWFYIFVGGILVIAGACNLFSGLFIQKKKNRLFSLVVAGINILQLPFGTLLGVFTFIVLLRDSVREAYEA
jgi:magnesium-transporting ATPase (P-type)